MKAFLTGLGIGVGLGILFAPDRGERTRSKVHEKVYDWSDRFSQLVNGARTNTAAQANQPPQRTSGRGNEQNALNPLKKPLDGDSINALSRNELMTVNGIGPVLADRIISGRPYSSARDLVDRGIIAQSTLDALERQFGLKEPA
jgi:DNA uptake protein ComE-like DNA-binding protein